MKLKTSIIAGIIAILYLVILYISRSFNKYEHKVLDGVWYGFFDDSHARKYDWIAKRDLSGNVFLKFRHFSEIEYESDMNEHILSVQEDGSDWVLEERGYWSCNGHEYYTSTEDPNEIKLSILERIQDYISLGYWENYERYEHRYDIIEISSNFVVYQNPDTKRIFWNLKVSEDFDFPNTPITMHEARSTIE